MKGQQRQQLAHLLAMNKAKLHLMQLLKNLPLQIPLHIELKACPGKLSGDRKKAAHEDHHHEPHRRQANPLNQA